ncbi:MAG: tRNA (adenosine(37)-N6)-threonylcarbamoyltransferase complex ATPase subunit type 1 TsaE [Panacagrimonas sp.]
MRSVHLADESATAALGASLASSFLTVGGGVLYLHGDLGAGKTTLARGFLRAAGVAGTLRSPTYTLMEPYLAGTQAFLHLDLYRLVDPSEVEHLGLRDYPVESTIWLIEWPERGAGHLPPADVNVVLRHRELSRVAEIAVPGPRHTIDFK